MTLLLTIFIIIYCVFILIISKTWDEIKPTSNNNLTSEYQFISIIIPIRNEADNIITTLQSIIDNDYDKSHYEILVINDHSTDNSAELVNEFISNQSHVRLLHLAKGLAGKKQAISLAISKSKGIIILCTDGDCELPGHWIKSYADAYRNDDNLKLVFGAVAFKTSTFIDSLLQLELSGLVGLGAATAELGFPSMISGANFSYLKSVFEEVNGYQGNENIPSGDDEFLLRKVAARYPKGIKFIKEYAAIVSTNPPDDFKSLLHQRKRWAGKWKWHKDYFSLLVPIFVFVLNALIIYGLYTSIIQSATVLYILAGKVLADYLFMKKMSDFYKNKMSLLTFLALEICYPFYVVFFGIITNLGGYSWKGRRF